MDLAFRADERLMLMRRTFADHLVLMDYQPELAAVSLHRNAVVNDVAALDGADLTEAAENDDDDDDERPDATIVGLAPALESKVFSIRNNDPEMNHMYVGSGLDPRAWKQLGRWTARSEYLYYFCLSHCCLKGKSMTDLCAGLQHNQSIREFEIGDNKLRKEELQSLAPFISNNPNLHTLNIEGCLGLCGVDLLSSALLCRTKSIENMSLDGNGFGGWGRRAPKGDFDALVTALGKNTSLRRLSLMGNTIGERECTSLARLLKNPDSKLKSLILRHNIIDNKCAAILAESLADNVQLNNIDLDRNERVQAKGLMAFLQLISRTPSTTLS